MDRLRRTGKTVTLIRWLRDAKTTPKCGLPKSEPVRFDASKTMNIFNRTKPLQPVTLSYDEILEYEAAFRAVDVDNDGAIDVKELGTLLCGVGLRPSEEEIAAMISSVDHDNDQVLNICEFINLMSRQHNPFVTPLSQFKAVFRVFDTDNNGQLTKDEFKDLIFSLGQKCSESELKTLMDFLDKDKDGTISETEFLKFFLTDSPQWLEKLANLDKTIRQL
ncbi:hypothetical protein ACHWQZ_G017705 [Mnemiopsis leidyi]